MRRLFFKSLVRGFTLAEVLVVVIIIGVLASLTIPRYQIAVESIRAKEGVQILIALLGTERDYLIENGVYTNDLNQLGIEIPASPNFNSPSWCAFPSVCSSYGGSIQRRDNSYTLYISQEGEITCTGGNGICTKMGYPT